MSLLLDQPIKIMTTLILNYSPYVGLLLPDTLYLDSFTSIIEIFFLICIQKTTSLSLPEVKLFSLNK